ncbi:MAG TPA: trypsin-like serine protease [Acholeplasmataceae bacterium]|jgi:S1-C subfamily serine protease|nr:trypsin-like serine protease [Acholeplasmataceae bacterium]
MKRILLVILLMFLLSGCDGVAVNEIYNKTYNVGEISITTLEEAIIEVSEFARNSVVGISKYKKGIFAQENLEYTGSGVIYDCKATLTNGTIVSNCETTIESKDVREYTYYVVTNRHVIEEENGAIRHDTNIKVNLGFEDAEKEAELLHYENSVDLAVLKFTHHTYIQPLRFGDSSQLKIGTFVLAIGNPAGHEYYGTTTFGIVSGPIRYIKDKRNNSVPYIQHDAAINSGNSGGALVNLNGELVGINTLKLASSEIDNIYENMGFAIPVNLVWDIVKEVK